MEGDLFVAGGPGKLRSYREKFDAGKEDKRLKSIGKHKKIPESLN